MPDLDRYYTAVAKLLSARLAYTENQTEENRRLVDRAEAAYAEAVMEPSQS